MLFSFCYPFYYLLFLDKNKKKALHNIFVFNSNGLQIEHIVEKTKCKRKKIKREDSQIFQEFSDIEKGFVRLDIKIEGG
jgi:hypothetical protein